MKQQIIKFKMNFLAINNRIEPSFCDLFINKVNMTYKICNVPIVGESALTPTKPGTT